MNTLAAPRVTPRATADGFEFALARLHARLAWRGSEPTWQRLHAARSLPALLDIARGTGLAPYVAGVAGTATLLQIDLAFQTQLRSRIDEVAGWLPAPWQPAARYGATLIDLPVQLHRQHEDARPAWSAAVPPAPLAMTAPVDRHDRRDGRDRPQRRIPASAALHPVLAAWLRSWQLRWPTFSPALQAWAERLAADVAALSAADLAQAPARREQLAARLVSDLHARADAQEIAPFAFLALLALDLHRLRAACVRARLTQEAA